MFLDFSFLKLNYRPDKDWRQFFQEIEEQDFLEEYRPNVHFAEVQSVSLLPDHIAVFA